MNDEDKDPVAPVLTEEGAALLAKVVARHGKNSARSHDHRRRRDPLRTEPDRVSVRPASPAVPEQPRENVQSGTSRTLVVLTAMVFVGLAFIGFAAWTVFVGSGPIADVEVQAEVAGAVEENDAIVDDGTDVAPAVEVEDVTAADSTDEPVGSSDPPAPEPTEQVPTASSPLALAGNIGLSVYDIDPINQGTRSFAIRISNASDEPVVSTEGFTIELQDADGERIPALVRFVHQEIPSGSSAIASVRVEGVPEGPTTAVLLFDGVDVDEQVLP